MESADDVPSIPAAPGAVPNPSQRVLEPAQRATVHVLVAPGPGSHATTAGGPRVRESARGGQQPEARGSGRGAASVFRVTGKLQLD